MKSLKKLGYIFDKKQKVRIAILAVMVFIGGLLETLGVSTLVPIIGVIMDSESVMNNSYVQIVLRIVKIEDAKTLTIALLLLMMGVYVVKNLYLLFQIKEQTRFITYSKNQLISRVLREFLNRPYEYRKE